MQNQKDKLATKSSRFTATLVDSIIVMLIAGPIIFFTGYFDNLSQDAPMQTTLLQDLIATFIVILVYSALNWKLLNKDGQTIGKRLVGIKIIMLESDKITALDILLKRYAPFIIIQMIPLIGPFLAFADVLTIFTKQRRCLPKSIILPNKHTTITQWGF